MYTNGLSPEETFRKTGLFEPSYQLFHTNGTPLVGGICALNEKRCTNPPLVKSLPKERCVQPAEEPWVHVRTRAEKYSERMANKQYSMQNQTLRIRDD